MTALEVTRPGATTTLQDGGRSGVGRWGVPRSGPVDALAHRLAARLAGVPGDDVAATTTVEVGPHPCELGAVDGPVALAVAGDGATVAVGGHTLTAPVVVVLRAGEVCTVRARTWAYVAPAASIDVPPVLGSRSHHPRSGLGPTLDAGTVLPLGSPRDVREGRHDPPVLPTGPLHVLAAPQTDAFTEAALERLVTATYRTTSDVDRMGMRLDGPTLAARDGHDIVSDGILPGALQVPGDGRPYVLTADHQTTGGYPKIAVLGPVDLARVTRCPPGTSVRFAWTDVAAARARLLAAHEAIDAAVAAAPRPHARALHGRNLIDGVTDPTTEAP